MIMMSWEKPSLSPAELYELWHRHKLLPMHLGERGMMEAVKATAAASRFGMVLSEDGGVLASTLTFLIEPGVLEFIWIPEVRRLDTRVNELIDLSKDLRAMWFTEGIRRVESRVPVARRQTIRTLIHMGFSKETEGKGLRAAVDYGKGPEGVAILGLLPDDPLKMKLDEIAEVVHG